MDDIFLIVIGDEILEWGKHECSEDVLDALFRYDADRLGKDYCNNAFDYHAVLGEARGAPHGQSYDVIHAPFAATPVVENTRSLKAVASKFLCQKYYRLVRSGKKHDFLERDCAANGSGIDDAEVSRSDPSSDLLDVKWGSGDYIGTQTKPFLMGAIGSYACFVDSDRTLVH